MTWAVKSGTYTLLESSRQSKILLLDRAAYAWLEPRALNELIRINHKLSLSDCVLSRGTYNLYRVKHEHLLTDEFHLELDVGNDFWQGYLLPSNLPTWHKAANIKPTRELVGASASLTLRQNGLKI